MPQGKPRPDPIPALRPSTRQRFWRIFRLLALLSTIIAAIAVLLVTRGEDRIHIHMIIATALGTGLTVLLGTTLMTLMFLSSSTGHDEEAAHGAHEENDQE